MNRDDACKLAWETKNRGESGKAISEALYKAGYRAKTPSEKVAEQTAIYYANIWDARINGKKRYRKNKESVEEKKIIPEKKPENTETCFGFSKIELLRGFLWSDCEPAIIVGMCRQVLKKEG